MGKKQVAAQPVRTPAGNSPAWRPIDYKEFGESTFFGRRKKKLDPGDFVYVRDGFTGIAICHCACAKKLIAVLSEAWYQPQETWTTASLKTQVGGVPVKHDLGCVICDSENPGWKYEVKLD